MGIGFVSFFFVSPDRVDADIEISGLERNAAVALTRFVTPPVFGVALSSITQRIIPQNRSKVKDQSAKLWYRLRRCGFWTRSKRGILN